MNRRNDPNALLPLAALIAIGVSWVMVSPAVAAGVGAVATVAWLALAISRAADLGRMGRAMRRIVAGDRGASMPLRVSTGLDPLNRAAQDLSSTLSGTRDSLAAERLRRRILEEALREGLVILDGHQRVLAANENAGRMLGFEPTAARGRLLQECTRAPALNALLADAFTSASRRQTDLEPPGAPGLVIEAVVACVNDESGRLAGALLLLGDVTAQRSLDRMRSDFAANVSHELRTPITNIRGYVETLLQVGLEDPAMARRFLEIVHRNASRLGALVEDLLSLSFVENPGSRERLEMADVAVARLFDWVEAELGAAAEARGIRIERAGDPGLTVHANALLAEQALANLVSNAIRYVPDGSRVELGARMEGDRIAITVSDEGPGIPERHLPRLFERFYRVESARTREGGGTGLGLAIVKHIAIVHGGSIDVDSVPGKGSVFTLRLPAGSAPCIAAEGRASGAV
jgi:two-component system phosphate regulon sensor histidine kinase PhoR